jgi:hypothetical protein
MCRVLSPVGLPDGSVLVVEKPTATRRHVDE